jgi:hypothetical protein
VDTAELLDLGKQLVEIGAEQGVTLRILGHLAIRDHVKELYVLRTFGTKLRLS